MDTFWGPDLRALERTDPEIAAVVRGELTRQRTGLDLIASENFASPAVLAVLGSTLTNKYAEGYPGARYYGGCAQVDVAEELAVQRARDLLAPSTPTCNRTRGPRRTWRPTRRWP